jgi:uncharacterized phage protein (TIGR01671 family)
MSREIKFRAFQDNQMLTSPISSNYGLARFFGLLYEDAPVMMYSGFKDENGKDVYEGDIISSNQWNPREYKVIFEDGEFCFVSLKGVEKPYTNPIHYVENFSVIGNIYENPELLSERS